MTDANWDDGARCRHALFRASRYRSAPIQVVWPAGNRCNIDRLAARIGGLGASLSVVADLDAAEMSSTSCRQGLLTLVVPGGEADALALGRAELLAKRPSLILAGAKASRWVLTACGVANDRRTIASALSATNGEANEATVETFRLPIGSADNALDGIDLPTPLPTRFHAKGPYRAEMALPARRLRRSTTADALARGWGTVLCRYTAQAASAFQLTSPASANPSAPSLPRVAIYRDGREPPLALIDAAASARLYETAGGLPVATAIIGRPKDYLDTPTTYVYEERPYAMVIEYIAGTVQIQATYDPMVIEQAIAEGLLEAVTAELEQTRYSNDHSTIRRLAIGPTLSGRSTAADATPGDSCSIVASGQNYSRAEIIAWARALATALASDAAPANPVGLALERGPEAIIAMLACLEAGRPFVPLDINWPSAVRADIVRDSGASRTLGVDDVRRFQPTASPDARTIDPPNGHRTAYVIYTSGTTGPAKGVVVSTSALSQYVESVGRHYPLSPESVVLWSSSPAFDSTIVETIVAFFNHARIVIPDADDLQSARAFWSLCERERVTILPISTALWHLVARPICVGERCAPASLRVVSFGGERANINLVSAWLRRAPQVRLLNGYGPTEAVVEALSAALNDVPEILRTVSVPIGRPMPGRVAYVLSPTSVPPSLCAFGEIGELYLGGTLADGYLGDQVHTTNRFVENRFGSGVLYRTGDLASLWPDGLFYFHGRRDREAKVRGYRINLDYLEEMLACASGVAQAAVVTHEGRLEAYVVLAEKAVTEHDVIAWVERTIPRSMQPTSVTVRDTLPLTPAGKLDRMALIAEEQDLTQTAPSDSEAVREAWTAVLESGVSAHSTVAGHGGDSLSLARIAAYLERHYGIDLPMDVMYSKPTLREQQEWVTQRRR